MTHPLFRQDIFVGTPFAQRFQAMLRSALHKRSWHVLVADPGSGKTVGIRNLVQTTGAPVILAVTAPKNNGHEQALSNRKWSLLSPHPGTITCSVPRAALSKQVILTRNSADDLHAQGQVDSEQNMVREPAGSTVHESHARGSPVRQSWIREPVLRANKRGRHKMYYRVAIQEDTPPSWHWKSSVLSSLHLLFQWVRLFRALPQDHLRVFSSSSREGLAEQFEQESKGLASIR